MSKGNMLLGHARGKVGDIVFSRANGQQIVRSRAAVVKNPKTVGQMVARVLLNTVAQAYSAMRPICDHSFEGVQVGQPSMSRFMTRNITNLRQRVVAAGEAGFDNVFAFTPVGSNELMYNAYTVSTGSLPTVPVTFNAGNTDVAIVSVPTNTYRGVIDAFGLTAGDQLTFVQLHSLGGGRIGFAFARVILMPAGGDLSAPFVVDGAVNLPNELNEGSFAALAFADGSLTFRVEGLSIGAAGVIVSRRGSDGNWRRSNCTLTVASSVVGYSMSEALALSADASALALESSYYLNNANQNAAAIVTFGGKTYTDITGVDGAVYAVATDGTQLRVKNSDETSANYNKLLAVSNGVYSWVEGAAASAFTASATPDGGGEGTAPDLTDYNNYQFLVAHGVPSTIW